MTTAKMTRREQYAAMTRAALLESARRLFVEQGFDAASVDDIARDCDVSKGAVYHHFRDKQELFVEVYRDSERKLMEAVMQVHGQQLDADPWDLIVACSQTVLRRRAADAEGCALLKQASTVLGAERRQQLDSELVLPLIRGLVQLVHDAGRLQPVDIDVAAQLVFHILSESSMLIAFSPDPQTSAEKVEAVMLRMFEGLHTKS
ncbi:TetR/AcrR family transcriptional regulator [Nocardia pseudovaccinii]|uniref:TetR/AcrR family transcriptional regulator n=1 Tax=Nocardia pseudovaccinii TaxID=189540 RepID=UPI003D922D2C